MKLSIRPFALALLVGLACTSLGVRANTVKETAEDIKDGAVAAGKHTGEAAKTVGKTVGSKAKTFGKDVAHTSRKVGRQIGPRMKAAYRDSKGRLKQSVKDVKAGKRDPEATANSVPDPR